MGEDRMRVRPVVWLLAVLGGVAGSVNVEAQGADSAATPPRPCTQPECRQFDFWIGDWDVSGPNGQAAGKNSIRRVLGGCALHESWTSANGAFSGHSYNTYDAARGRWHQTWVDNSGTVLQLDGGFVGGKMVLTGLRPPAQAGAMDVMHRISWEKKSENEVCQLWETSPDGGQTWSVAFDGKYVRRKG
jgi:hypothetical protein